MHAQTIVINNHIDRCKSCLAPCRVSKKRIYKRDQAGEKNRNIRVPGTAADCLAAESGL